MKIAITGATGFIGSALAANLAQAGHHLILIARGSAEKQANIRYIPNSRFVPLSISDQNGLATAFEGCTSVVHSVGISRETGGQTFDEVHVRGTAALVNAARAAGVRRIAMVSFLRARAACGSRYHETKWAAEECVRDSGLEFTILKCGLVYGPGDHLLDHLSRSLHTLPLFATVGLRSRLVAPVAIEDITRILRAVAVEGRLRCKTVAVTGPERLSFDEIVRRVARTSGRRVFIVPMPVWFHWMLAAGCELFMTEPLISRAQVWIIAEGVADPLPGADELPAGLRPTRAFTGELIRAGLPERRATGSGRK